MTTSYEASGTLVDGSRFYANARELQVVGSDGQVMATVPVADITHVSRSGHVVTISRKVQRPLILTVSLVEQAEALEAVLQPAPAAATTATDGRHVPASSVGLGFMARTWLRFRSLPIETASSWQSKAGWLGHRACLVRLCRVSGPARRR